MAKLSSVEIVGAGPSGLYAAILISRLLPEVRVRVSEQNAEGATFGFGVVFSAQALEFLRVDDPQTYDLVTPHMERWRNMTLNLPDGTVKLDGVGFTAIGRLQLIEILTARAMALGVQIRFDSPISSLDSLGADLVIGADGLNSVVRRTLKDRFAPELGDFENHFAWFGATIPFETLTQTFIETEFGPMNAHHYRYAPDRSTFIVECDPASFAAAGFAAMDEAESARLCSRLFGHVLQGTELITNRSMWRQFPRLWCANWVADRYALLGDAAHTAHFSIGSGTRLAMEDAIALVHSLADHGEIEDALAAYQQARPPIARKIVEAANTSAEWYESFGAKMCLHPMDFAHDYLMRSGRISEARLRQIAPGFAAEYAAHRQATGADARKDGTVVLMDPVPADAPGAREIGFDKAAHCNCAEILWQNLARNPDRVAVTGPACSLSYLQLIAEAARWGNAFVSAGLRRGERIAFFLDDTPIFAAAFYGAVRAGFVPVLLNIQTRPDMLAYFLADSGARVALVEAGLTDAFAPETVAETPLRTMVVANGPAPDVRFTSAADFIADQPPTLDAAETSPDDMAFWMYSSGSTGRPKGIVHLHHDMAYIQQAYGERVLKLREDDLCYSVPKAYFAYGFGNSLVFPFARGAASLLVPGQPRPNVVLDAIERFRPTVLFGLPTLYTALVGAEGIDRRDLSSLRQSMSAAEILSEEVYAAWKRRVGHGPTEGLGSTEMLHVYLSNQLDDHRPGAAGARVPGYEVRLETPEGQPAGPGEEGVMLVRGHSSAPIYWNRPEKTRETMRDDWIHTGDRFVERDGYYYFQGRADDLIKVSGQWVWPLEVERCLNEHPEVHECAVLAQELEGRRMALRAVVALKPGRNGDAAQTVRLRAHVKARLAPYKAPRLVDYVAELPKTGTGKIDRQALLRGPATAV